MVDQTLTNWNPLIGWLREMDRKRTVFVWATPRLLNRAKQRLTASLGVFRSCLIVPLSCPRENDFEIGAISRRIEPRMPRKGLIGEEAAIDDARENLDAPIPIAETTQHQKVVEVRFRIRKLRHDPVDHGAEGRVITGEQRGCPYPP